MRARKILSLITAACFWLNMPGISTAFDLFGAATLRSQREELQRQQAEIERNRAEIDALKREQQQKNFEDQNRRKRKAEEKSQSYSERRSPASERSSSPTRRASSSVDKTPYQKSSGKRLNGEGILRVINGNTAEIVFLEGNATDIVYFDDDHKVYFQKKGWNHRPAYSADWAVSGDKLCMHSRGVFCYYLTYADDHLEGWAIKPDGVNKSILMTMYKGDMFDFIKQRQASDSDTSWKSAAELAGLLIIGAALAYLVFGNSGSPAVSDDSYGNESADGGSSVNDNICSQNPSLPACGGASPSSPMPQAPPTPPIDPFYGDTHTPW